MVQPATFKTQPVLFISSLKHVSSLHSGERGGFFSLLDRPLYRDCIALVTYLESNAYRVTFKIQNAFISAHNQKQSKLLYLHRANVPKEPTHDEKPYAWHRYEFIKFIFLRYKVAVAVIDRLHHDHKVVGYEVKSNISTLIVWTDHKITCAANT